MMHVALTFIGKDRPGIIARVSQILHKAQCNIEDATMTILEGQFAMILIAALPHAAIAKRLMKDFSHLRKRWGLICFRKSIPQKLVRGEKHPAGHQTYVISVMGKDRTGIVHGTSRILARHHLNITDLNSKILGEGKQSVFAMLLEVDIPKGFSLRKIDPEWRKLKSQFGVDVRVKRVERLNL